MITGLLAGAANGFFGAGGGLFLVPLFTRWLHLEQRRAFATSVAVVLPLSVAALVSYALEGGVDVGAALPYLAGGLVGGWIGGKIFEKVPVVWLKRAFALLILYGAWRALAG